MTFGQPGAVCPQCGSATAVHSIGELAAWARAQLGEQGGTEAPRPGYPGQPQPGPVPGWAAEPQAGPLPGPAGPAQPGPVPGWAAQPRSGPLPGPGVRRARFPAGLGGGGKQVEDELADAAIGAVTRFIGRAISRRVQRTLDQQVLPAVAAKQEEALRAQIAIAERHPDLRACLTDEVIFLAGGSRVLPMSELHGLPTLEQSDALVARLRDG